MLYISFELISRKMNNYRKGQICNIVGAFTCFLCSVAYKLVATSIKVLSFIYFAAWFSD